MTVRTSLSLLIPGLLLASCSAFGPSDADLTATAAIELTANAVQRQSTQVAAAGTESAQVRATEAQDGVRFLVVNQTSVTFCMLFVSPTTATDWEYYDAFDLIIAANSQGDVRVADGEYDLRVDDCEGTMLAEAYGVSVPEYTVWTLTDDDLVTDATNE